MYMFIIYIYGFPIIYYSESTKKLLNFEKILLNTWLPKSWVTHNPSGSEITYEYLNTNKFQKKISTALGLILRNSLEIFCSTARISY